MSEDPKCPPLTKPSCVACRARQAFERICERMVELQIGPIDESTSPTTTSATYAWVAGLTAGELLHLSEGRSELCEMHGPGE